MLLAGVYVLRLVVLEANSVAIVVPAALAGFVVSPLWYLSLGRAPLRGPAAPGVQT